MIVDRKTLNTLYALCHQFMIVRPVFSVLMCALLLLDVYHVSLVPWLFPLSSDASVYLAFYSLLLFYHAFEHQLHKHNPWRNSCASRASSSSSSGRCVSSLAGANPLLPCLRVSTLCL